MTLPCCWANLVEPVASPLNLISSVSYSLVSQQHSNLHTSIGNSVWGSLNTNPSSQWASDLVSNIWSNADTKNSNMGFWDDAVKEVGPRNATNKNKSNASIR